MRIHTFGHDQQLSFTVVNLPGIVRVGSLAGLAIVLLVAAIAFQRVVLRGRDE